MVIRNKRGWLRIVEASVGVLIVAGVLLTLYAQQVSTRDLSEQIYELQIYILNEIANNDIYRGYILNLKETYEPSEDIKNFINEKIPDNFGFKIKICNINEVCGLGTDGPAHGDIYAEERIISANLKKYSPKKIKLYIWEL